MRKSFVLELREEWSEPVDECIALLSSIQDYFRFARYPPKIGVERHLHVCDLPLNSRAREDWVLRSYWPDSLTTCLSGCRHKKIRKMSMPSTRGGTTLGISP